MVSVAFLHVSFMWYVSDRLLSKLTPRTQTLSVSSMTVLAKESFSMLGILVNRDVNSIPSVFSVLFLSMFCVFHRITSSIQFHLLFVLQIQHLSLVLFPKSSTPQIIIYGNTASRSPNPKVPFTIIQRKILTPFNRLEQKNTHLSNTS